MRNYPFVITISSEKGGVGKTTLATNLAIYLKALNEDLPVTIFSFDNHFTVDKMFEIKGQEPQGSVIDLLLETPAENLIHTGQYGVGYIPSSADLADLKHSIKGPLILARLLAQSNVPGVIVIDTRPDLDILTQNALFAADRVVIPVKDMASLENCRNIFEVFDKRGLDRKSLALIPCLVDSRIKYEGPFKNQQDLLKAYAINRGYRCFDCFISKSPKVETLNTNPDGKIYPVLTHAVGTDVHSQYGQLAALLLDEIDATGEPRSYLFHQWLLAEEGRKKEAYMARLEGLNLQCLFCGEPLPAGGGEKISFYFETSDGAARGFIDERCYLEFLMTSVFGIDNKVAPGDPTWLVFEESAREGVFVFSVLERQKEVEVHRFSFDGKALSSNRQALKENGGGLLNREKSRLFILVGKTLTGYGGNFRNAFLLVYPVAGKDPASILQEENYRSVSVLKKKIASLLEIGHEEHGSPVFAGAV